MPKTKTLREEGNQRIVQCGTRAIWEERKGSKWMVVGAYFTNDKPGMAKMFREFDMAKRNPDKTKVEFVKFESSKGPGSNRIARVRVNGQIVSVTVRGYVGKKGKFLDGRGSRPGTNNAWGDPFPIHEDRRSRIKEAAVKAWEAGKRAAGPDFLSNPKSKDRSSEPKSGRFSRKASALFAKGADKVNSAIQDTAEGKNPLILKNPLFCPSCGGAFKNPIEPGKWTCSGCGAEVEIS